MTLLFYACGIDLFGEKAGEYIAEGKVMGKQFLGNGQFKHEE
jgi:hypothetical protein